MFFILQEIDDLLSGGLTSQDEDDVLAELDAIVQVNVVFSQQIYYTVRRSTINPVTNKKTFVNSVNQYNMPKM